MFLTREKLLEQKLQRTTIDVPWIKDNDGNAAKLVVQQMSAKAMDEYRWLLTTKDRDEIRKSSPNSFIFVNCVVDEDGKRLYTDEDLTLIAETVDPDLIDLVVQAVDEMTEASDERKDALKKSSTTPLSAVASGK